GALGFSQQALAGFGITPPYVRNDTLRPGSEYTQEIIIVRSDPVEDLNAEITMYTPGIETWFSVDRGMKFVLPKGESQVRMNITVRVPEDANLGSYSGNIRIRTSSLLPPTTGVSLALGAQIDVHLKVVEEIYDFSVRRVELFEAEQGVKKWWLYFPGKIKFAMYIENIGNVPAFPPKVHFDIYDTTGQTKLESTEHTNTIDRILPFNTKKVYAFLPTTLPPGGYRAKYTIYKQGEDVAQQGELSLSILPHGTIPDYEGYGFEGLSIGDKLSVIVPVVLLLFAIIGFFWVRISGRGPRRPRRERRDDPPSRSTSRSAPRHISGGVVDLSRRK
ncbi:MAG TPA: hypothetical protein VLB83_03520, partial [Candidatus Paceibacterota bacterium]|nr:hypothetical protein [Candidatus Paceibacterota bacterium]